MDAEMTFEQAMSELEMTIAKIEGGDLSLEASLQLYERGQQLVAFCSQQLENATLKVEQLSADGEIIQIE